MATIELLIAFTILILNISAAALVINGGQSIQTDSALYTEATALAESMLEDAKVVAKQDFRYLRSSVVTEGAFEKRLEVRETGLFTKAVESVVSFQSGGRSGYASFSTVLNNLDAIDGGDTCSSTLEGNWNTPSITSYDFAEDILGNPAGIFPITSILAFDGRLYVTVNNQSLNNAPSFFILSTDRDEVPEVIGTLDNNLSVSGGLNSVAIDGKNYAYVANGHEANFSACAEGPSCAQLQVIDIRNPLNPQIVRNYKIPGVGGNPGQAIGKTIIYQNGVVYLGLSRATGTEFNIIDVGGGGTEGATPINPIWLSGFETDSNGINNIFIRGGYAYIASSKDEELEILDISDFSNPIEVGEFNAPGGGANNGNGKSLALLGDSLYLGRTLLSGDEFYILDNSHPDSTLSVRDSANIQNLPNNTSVNGIVVRDHLVFLLTNGTLKIWDISNPEEIREYTDPIILPPGEGNSQQGTAIDCEGNYIFTGSQNFQFRGFISIISGS